jgi:phosphatidylglycerol:prolipoprotein diacylglycerol transferase
MFPIFFHAGPIVLHTYGLMIALGFILAYQVARGEFRRRGMVGADGEMPQLETSVWHIMIGALIGARVAYTILNGWTDFLADPLSFFKIWEGGLVFYGGAIGGFIGLLIASRRWPGTLLRMTDAFAAPLLLGQAFGRIGCFSAGCCYGRPTSAPWGVTFTNPNALAPLYEKLHPTQLYESFGVLVLFLIALALSRRVREVGWLTVFYCVSYGVLRFAVEFWRGDDRGAFHFYLSPSQWGSLALIVLGQILGVMLLTREKRHA